MEVTTPKKFDLERVTVGGKRHYRSPSGLILPSVTSVLGIIGKPALVGWAAKEERLLVSAAAADLYEEAGSYLNRTEYLEALQLKVGTSKAHQRLLKKAGEIGTQAHALIEWWIENELGRNVRMPQNPLPEASLAFGTFLAWVDEVHFNPVASEVRVFSEELAIAGTLDFIAWMDIEGERKLMLGDVKTGKRIYMEAFLQNVAYQVAWEEMDGMPLNGGIILRLPKVITDPGFEVAIVPPREELVPVFKAAKQLFDWQWKNQRADKIQEEEMVFEEVNA